MDPRSGFISDFFNKVVFGLQILVSGGVWCRGVWCRGVWWLVGGWRLLLLVFLSAFRYILLHFVFKNLHFAAKPRAATY